MARADHEITTTIEQRNCCDNPAHTMNVARCKCGWEAFYVSDMDEALATQILRHRVEIIEENLGISVPIVDKGWDD